MSFNEYPALKRISEAGPTGTWLKPDEFEHAKQLIAMGHIQVNGDVKSPEGHPATRATDQGHKLVAEMNAQAAAHAAASGVPGAAAAAPQPFAAAFAAANPPAATAPVNYQIERGVPMPERKRGPGRTADPSKAVSLPLDQLNIGDSIFIGATDSDKTPAKRLGPYISQSNRKLFPKVFSIHTRGPNDGDPRGVGARVFRSADSTLQAPPERKPRGPRKGTAASAATPPAPAPQSGWAPPAAPATAPSWDAPAASGHDPNAWA